jgi:small subunit ribosomal protein S6
MALSATLYDLMLILDPQAEADARTRIVADTRAAIEAQGELTRYDEWGERPLAYPIEHRTSGEYHLFQFHPGNPELLHSLDRTLRITDGIVRFRIIKLKPGVPAAPDMSSAAAPAARRSEPEAASETPEPAPATVASGDAD